MIQLIFLVLASIGVGLICFDLGQRRATKREHYLYKHTCTHCKVVCRSDDKEDILAFTAKHQVAHVLMYEWRAIHKNRETELYDPTHAKEVA